MAYVNAVVFHLEIMAKSPIVRPLIFEDGDDKELWYLLTHN